MVVGPIVNQLKNLITPLGGVQIRHFSTENSNSTEQSTKWDKLEGKLTSDFISLESWKEIKEGGLETVGGLLEGSISLDDLESIDLKELEIPVIFNPEKDLFGGRFEEKFFYIHSKEKEKFFKLFIHYEKDSWLYFVGAKGSLNLYFFLTFVKNRIWKEPLPLCDGCLFMV